MKSHILKLAFVIAILSSGVFAQAIDNITRRCKAPNNSVFGKILVTAIGDITYEPCPARSNIFSGNVDFSGATIIGSGFVTGTGTANFVPRFTAASVIGNTPLSWNTTSYIFQNTALNAEFILDLTPDVAGGRFRVGDFTTTPTDFLDINQTTGISLLQGSNSVRLQSLSQVLIGDATSAGNDIRIEINDGAQTIDLDSRSGNTRIGDWSGFANGTSINITDASNTIELKNSTNNAGVLDVDQIINTLYFRTLTAGGTTGARTINRPLGSVNFAGAATTLVVTNSVASATSLIFLTPQTADATCTSFAAVRAAGSFTITANAACTAETAVAFMVTN